MRAINAELHATSSRGSDRAAPFEPFAGRHRRDGNHNRDCDQRPRAIDSAGRLQLTVNQERDRLRLTRNAAGNHDRRAEFAEAAREGQDRPGDYTVLRKRQRDREESVEWPRPKRGAACSKCGSTLVKASRMLRTKSGNAITADASAAPFQSNTNRTPSHSSSTPPSQPRRPKSTSSRYPVTTGGSTSGRNTAVSTIVLPQNCLRQYPSQRDADRQAANDGDARDLKAQNNGLRLTFVQRPNVHHFSRRTKPCLAKILAASFDCRNS